ncbi:uncharacterized protein LOC128042965 [Gossypium raimondii]|uniref:uncharacterized protein LOC128042965 n=1 Tax=Gossypium raimondii TaxID=29730 RepID=UPI00227B0EC0|nr:uncharacterized protein LOC128042965 [Gossypium raimondii]
MVVLRTEKDNEVVMIGERQNYLSNVIFVLVAEKMVRKGCEAFLAYTELGELRVMGPELVLETKDKVRLIRDHLKMPSDRHKSYAGLKRREIEYSVGDFMFLKVLPWKKILRFGRKGKLSSRFLKRVRLVTYQLELPLDLDQILDVFHVSMLRCYLSDPTHIVLVEEIKLRPDLTFEEELIQILDREVNVMRRKSIPLVKILWRNHCTNEATWEPKDAMCQQYPYSF